MINPFFYIEVWRSQGNTFNGRILDVYDYEARLKLGYSLHSFTGRKATICVVACDKTIDRSNKLDFAIHFMEGSLINIAIDLNKLTATTTRVNPPPDY